ncbi:FKBP-type peptidyl-prolyl cis-trans isomerase FkpA precursor [Candidatus Gullanella endobia]|uniref:Peptidyl-prolyl cis-trans isomerase n=1 Tax=Candidatus Gullanella endobia TaxID=1070130 RepID=A0A143WPU4_9ENTR|nr:FKBP-type peptidyl-prolyl cis-trans isomerase [Candidatus Gullanella endobia]CUX95742.1 FKBP-type peptidyl-prolyl cis-trans isomerase FkpA precursor [Candidatus Gullanella endobia]
MKLLIKILLLVYAMKFLFNINNILAVDTALSTTLSTIKFKNKKDQASYAIGVSLGRYVNNSLKEQEKLGIKLNKDQLISGIQDTCANKIKLSNQEIKIILQSFEARVKSAAQTKIEKEAKENAIKGDKYRADYSKEKGVKKTLNGILYKINKTGTGNMPTDSDTVVVNYKGTFVDETEFDNSYKRGEPLFIRLDSVIPGWTEGLKQIKKGGKIQLVIPPEQAYGKAGVPDAGIPANSTLVFDVELLDIRPIITEPENMNADK